MGKITSEKEFLARKDWSEMMRFSEQASIDLDTMLNILESNPEVLAELKEMYTDKTLNEIMDCMYFFASLRQLAKNAKVKAEFLKERLQD